MADLYTPEELMAVVIAREVRDGETIGIGAASPVPAAGCILAAHLHASRSTLIILGSEEFYPFPAGSSELHYMAQKGELDLFFLSGIQIDRAGNINLHVLGDYSEPRVRLPGAYGSAMLYHTARRVILYRTEHTRRTFVDKVDFVTASGVLPENASREGGPSMVVTPKAVLSWDRATREWALAAVHPGSKVIDIEENTGFPLRVPHPVPVTPSPTPQELGILRTKVRGKLKRIYPEFAENKLMPASRREPRGMSRRFP
jgi:glutaconate CoA-transferase subunit B